MEKQTSCSSSSYDLSSLFCNDPYVLGAGVVLDLSTGTGHHMISISTLWLAVVFCNGPCLLQGLFDEQ